jgi:uncharacterized repeat protein (TIGR01451 family)
VLYLEKIKSFAMKKIVFFLSLILVTMLLKAQSYVVFHENFDSPSNADSVIASGAANNFAINSRLYASPGHCDSTLVSVNDTTYLTTNTFSTISRPYVCLSFSHICKIELLDKAIIEVSTDNGLTWTQLTGTEYINPGNSQFVTNGNRFNSNTYPLLWAPASGTAKPTQNWWKDEVFDISYLVGNHANVKVRFVLSDGNGNGAFFNHGWYIDDIKVRASATPIIFGHNISGCVFNDINGNGIKDSAESGLVGLMVKLINNNSLHSTLLNGKYYLSCDSGTYQVQCVKINYTNFTTDSIKTFYVPDYATLIDTIDFGIQFNPVYSDVQIDINGSVAVTNLNAYYWLTYKNLAGQPKSGTIDLTIDSLTTFVSSSPPPDAQNGNTISWNYTNLLSLETRQIPFVLHMPGVTNLGDTITTTAIINPVPGDAFPPNNYDTLRQRIIGSYDPNDKLVDKGKGAQGYTLFGDELEYTIRFQNTGTAPAGEIRITDIIDDNLDIASFCLISYSHPVSVEITGDTVMFLFKNIQLPDSGTNLAASNGFVKYGMKPKSNLAENTPVTNQADIYFDFNPAVTTNQTLNTYVSAITVGQNFENAMKDKTLMLYPNPSSGLINIAFAESAKDNRIDVINSLGLVVLTKHNNTSSTTLDLSNHAKGIYFIKLQSGNGVAVKKVIIE